jgi:peroxin-6
VYSLDTQDCLDSAPLRYKVIMAEPVPQGFAQKSQTLFTLLPPADSSQAIDRHHVSLSSTLPEDVQTEDDDEGLEIGEDFLASSLIPQTPSYSPQNDSSTIRVSRLAHEFTANPLSMPISLDPDEYTMYVRTVDLPKVGVLDGDWVSGNTDT